MQLARLLDRAEQDADDAATLRSFDALLIGGQSTPQALRERAAALGARIRLTYGSSETAGGCVYDGVPLQGVQVRVDDGQVLLGGPTLAVGYLDSDGALDDERSALAFVTDGGRRWYRTGDSGVLVDGRLSVTGRLDRVLVSGGEKVSLDALEAVLREGASPTRSPSADRTSAGARCRSW